MAIWNDIAILPVALAPAAEVCDRHETILKLFAEKYREAPVAIGITNGGGLVEVLTNNGGETWTIIVTTLQGMSCLIAAGEDWRMIDPKYLDPET